MNARRLASVATCMAALVSALTLADEPTVPPSTPPATHPSTQPGTSPTDPVPSYEDDAELMALIEPLADADFAIRTAAQRELLLRAATRPDWLAPIAEAAKAHPDPEIRSRCGVVVKALHDQRRFGPSRISLTADKVTAEVLAMEFLAKIDATFDDIEGIAPSHERRPRFWPEDDPFNGNDQARNRIVSVVMDDVEFWEAVRIFGRETDLWPNEDQAGFMFSQHSRPMQDFPQSKRPETSDPNALGAIVELASAQRNASRRTEFLQEADGGIREADGGGGSSLGLSLRVLLEPKLVLTGQQARSMITEAIDDSGRDLRGEMSEGRSWTQSGSAAWSLQMNIPLDVRAASDSTSIALLKGFVEFEAAARVAIVDLDVSQAIVKLVAASESAEAQPNRNNNGDNTLDTDESMTSIDLDLSGNVGPWEVKLVQMSLPQMPEHMQRRMQMQWRRGQNARVEADPVPATPTQLMVVIEVVTPDIEEAFNDGSIIQGIFQSLSLVDAQGRAWQSSGQDQDYDEDRTKLKLTITYSNWQQDAGMPTRLIWAVPLEKRTLRVPFTFEDIPLPELE